MSTFTAEQRRFMKRISTMTSHERFLADQKRKKAEADLKARHAARRFATQKHELKRQESFQKLKKKAKTQTGDVDAFLERQALRGKRQGSRSENAASIPNQNTTVASLVSRGGFQSPGPSSPGPSPPTTPTRSARLVRTVTPLTLNIRALSGKQPPVPSWKSKGKEKISSRTRAGHKKLRTQEGKAKKPAKPKHIDISEETDSGEEKEVESEPVSTSVSGTTESASDTEVESSEVESATESSDPGDLSDYDSADEEQYFAFMGHNWKRLAALMKKPRGVSAVRGDTNVPAFRAARAKEKRARQAFKKTRIAKRHKITTHHPFVPKLQIRQKGPGQFSVRSNGISDVVTKHVQSLLSRIKGKLFVNGKFTAPKRAFSVIMALLRQKQVIEIVLK